MTLGSGVGGTERAPGIRDSGEMLQGAEDMDLSAAWTAAMRRGEFGRAWEIADRALAANVAAGPSHEQARHEQWVWDGRPLRGKRLLVRCYHGLGDTIQFSRFLPELRRLEPVMANNEGATSIRARASG